MTYDFIKPIQNINIPLYQQLYDNISTAIENGNLPQGTKLPSIRKLSEDLHLSRTTVESAYQQLCVEGFIISRPQRGYFVHIDTSLHSKLKAIQPSIEKHDENKQRIIYNLGSDSIDSDSADIKRWKSYVKDILNKQSVIISYGEAQGEKNLRKALSLYSYGVRGVQSDEDSIVIGAGTQPLLYILCGLIANFGKTVALEKGGFSKAEQVFEDCGFEVSHISSDNEGININELYKSNIKILFVNPSGDLITGQPMLMNKRYELLHWAQECDGIIIEDDYNGELRYSSRPIPALQGMDSERVVYIGSFSKLLLPSVRIGYMVLPKKLLEEYDKKADLYNQTASKIEQLALANYIHDGRLDRQLRRLRKIYAEKCTILSESLKNYFGNDCKLILQENSLCMLLVLNQNGTDIAKTAEEYGVKVTRVISDDQSKYILKIGFAGISIDAIDSAVKIISGIFYRS